MSKRAWLAIVLVLFVIAIIFLSGCSNGNHVIFSRTGQFDYALVHNGINMMKIELEKWSEYGDGKLQLWSTDGKVYLVNSVNTILVKD